MTNPKNHASSAGGMPETRIGRWTQPFASFDLPCKMQTDETDAPSIGTCTGDFQMKWDQVKRDWRSVSQQVKLKWGKLTDEDLAMISGDRQSFVRLFEQRYGEDQMTAEKKIDAFVLGLTLSTERSKILSWSQRCWKNIRSLTHVRPRI
jgi:uncharacterized protein YjbJ (UPF0337 family)